MTIHRLALSVVCPLVALVAVGCGGANSGGAGDADTTQDAPTVHHSDAGGGDTGLIERRPPDAGTRPPPSGDAASHDAGHASDASDAALLPEGAVLPNGTQVLASDVLTLNGLTTDGFAVYTDITTSTLYAVALTGGSTVTLGKLGVGSYVTVTGPVVFFGAQNPESYLGPISIWTSAAGVQLLGEMSTNYATAVSASGTRVIYLDQCALSVGGACDIDLANTDGSGHTVLVPHASVETTLSTAFAGETAVVGASDLRVGDAGASGVSLETFTLPSWTRATLATDLDLGGNLVLNPANTEVLAAAASGLAIYPVSGAQLTVVDPNGITGLFTHDGVDVVYSTASAELLLATPDAGSLTLASSGFPNPLALSPDNAWALGTVLSPPVSATSGDYSADLYFASATAPGATSTLSRTANVNDVGFTLDASQVVFLSDTSSLGLSNLHVNAVSGGGSQTYPGVWSFLTVTGSKLAFNDDYRPTGGVGVNGTADIEWLDTASSEAPSLLVSQADASFFVTADGKTLVYSWSYLSGHQAGIWTVALP
jgi:hypothetical protein